MDIKTLQSLPPWEWPSNVDRTFHKILTNTKAAEDDRLIAVGLAGDTVVINDTLVHDLLIILGSAGEPEKLRATAAISLGPILEDGDTLGFDDPDDVPITEHTFLDIKDSLHRLYSDTSQPKQVRRRILEASVRAPSDWHPDAIKQAYASADPDWKLTAVFCMRYVPGFESEILQALKSDDSDVHYEALEAAGNAELTGAWPHVLALVKDPKTAKPLLMAAMGAAASIRPKEARNTLQSFADSEDEDIAGAAQEAISTAESSQGLYDEDLEDEEDDAEWIN